MNTTAPKRRSRLLAVPPGQVEPRKPKVLVFGPWNVGKTWVSQDFPAPYYIDTEGGADLSHYRAKLERVGGVYFGPEHGALDFDAVIGQIEALATESHPYKTIIIDSITKLFNTAIVDEQQRLGDKDAYGASKKPAIRQMARLLRWLNRTDMNAILISHEKDEWGIGNSGERAVVGKTYDAWEKLAYELHLVLKISKIGVGDNAKRYANVIKSRLTGFPEGERFDWTYAAFAERYGKDVIEKEVAPLVLATPEQVAEITQLLAVIKLPDGTVDKWLTKAGAETFDEMSTDTIAACINHLKEKMTP